RAAMSIRSPFPERSFRPRRMFGGQSTTIPPSPGSRPAKRSAPQVPLGDVPRILGESGPLVGHRVAGLLGVHARGARHELVVAAQRAGGVVLVEHLESLLLEALEELV